jgi:antitoxin HicB
MQMEQMDLAQERIVTDHCSYSVALEPQEGGGFTVLAPTLPEVVTERETEQEALANAKEAIRAILVYRRDHGLSVTPPPPPAFRE